MDWTRQEAGSYTGSADDGSTGTITNDASGVWLWSLDDADGAEYASGQAGTLTQAKADADSAQADHTQEAAVTDQPTEQSPDPQAAEPTGSEPASEQPTEASPEPSSEEQQPSSEQPSEQPQQPDAEQTDQQTDQPTDQPPQEAPQVNSEPEQLSGVVQPPEGYTPPGNDDTASRPGSAQTGNTPEQQAEIRARNSR